MADPKPLTRDQLARFLPDQEAIKRFERLFAVAGDLTPSDVIVLYRLSQEASIDANTADAKAQMAIDQLGQVAQDAAINTAVADDKATEALDALNRIANSLGLLAQASVPRQDNSLATDYVDINPLAPTPVGAVGRLRWNDTDGTLDLGLKGGNVMLQVGQENVLRVKNDEATPLNDGEVVYIAGASGANLLVKRALADSDLTSASTIGVVTEPIAINGQGFITTFGQVRGFNTSAFNEGDVLYLSPTTPGAITNTKPTAPDHLVLVGYCTKKSAGNGEIFVKVDNGYELEELHNVLVTGPVLAGSLLIYDSTVGVWKNARLTPGTNVTITNADGSITITVSGTPPTGPAGGVLSGTYPNPGFAADMATQAELDAHTGNTSNPHSTTKTQVGLGNVTNDAQVKKAVSSVDKALVTWSGTSGNAVSGYSNLTFDGTTLLTGLTAAWYGNAANELGGNTNGVAVKAAGGVCIPMWNTATTGDSVFQFFYTEGSPTFRGSVVYNRAAGLVAYNTTSDYRAKDILGPVLDSGEVIDKLKPYVGRMKGASQSRPMFVAHEAQQTAPYTVVGEKDAEDEFGNPIMQQMDVSSLVPVIVAELQHLRERVKLLENLQKE